MSTSPPPDIAKLCDLVARLRSPDGCPWDREQTLGDLRAYLLEEAHEVAAAIDAGDDAGLAAELGDLLFQVVFVARLAEERGAFDLAAAIDAVHAKMIDRHPHVFGDRQPGEETPEDAAAVRRAWERRKVRRRRDRSLLQGVPASLPALTGAYRMSQKAAGVGFDWPHARAVMDKVREELAEIEGAAAGAGAGRDAVEEELGDLLFAVASLARHLGVDPEAALARGNLKFRRRFRELEESFARQGRSIADAEPGEMDREWRSIKRREG
jgi:MazG family protein